MEARAKEFQEHLLRAEKQRDPDILITLFSDDCSLQRMAQGSDEHTGASGAHRFWTEYFQAFKEVKSEFTWVGEQGNRVILEWKSRGELHDGKPFEYEGVTILDYAGDRIARFRTDYDLAHLRGELDRRKEATSKAQGAQRDESAA